MTTTTTHRLTDAEAIRAIAVGAPARTAEQIDLVVRLLGPHRAKIRRAA